MSALQPGVATALQHFIGDESRQPNLLTPSIPRDTMMTTS
jgi:hypothetical protein